MSSSTLVLALRNLGRNRRRTLLAVGAIALGQFTLVFVNCMMAGTYEDMQRTITGPLIGHVQVRHPDYEEERALDLAVYHADEVLHELSAVPGVRAVSPRLYAPVLAAFGGQSDQPADAEPAMLIGIDVGLESAPDGLLEELGEDALPGSGDVVVGRLLAKKLQVTAGDRVALIGQDADEFPASDLFTVTAVIRSGMQMIHEQGIVMPLETARTFLALPDAAHEILVYADRVEEADTVAALARKSDVLQGLDILTWKEAVPELAGMLAMKTRFDLIFLLIVFLAAAAGVINTMMMSTFERRREFGMLLAMGAAPGRIVRMVLSESMLLGLAGVFIGSLVGVGLVVWTSHTGIDYAALTDISADDLDFSYRGITVSYVLYPLLEWRHVFFGLGAVTFTSVLAGTWPSLHAAKMEPMEALKG